MQSEQNYALTSPASRIIFVDFPIIVMFNRQNGTIFTQMIDSLNVPDTCSLIFSLSFG